MFWSTHKIIISTGHELHHPHDAHFYCYFSHRLGIKRVKLRQDCKAHILELFREVFDGIGTIKDAEVILDIRP